MEIFRNLTTDSSEKKSENTDKSTTDSFKLFFLSSIYQFSSNLILVYALNR